MRIAGQRLGTASLKMCLLFRTEIAAHVVSALKLRLIGGVPVVKETLPDAYALYLRANFLLRQGTAESIRQAEDVIKQAIEIDSGYAPAWHSLGLTYLFGSTRDIRDAIDARPLIRDAIAKAQEIDPRLVDSYIERAQVAYHYEYDFGLAKEQLEIALELEPWSSHVHSLAATIAFAEGKFRDAVEHRETAHQLDPLAGHRIGFGVGCYYYAGYKDEALHIFCSSCCQQSFRSAKLFRMGQVRSVGGRLRPCTAAF